jgi:hypothetical protein
VTAFPDTLHRLVLRGIGEMGFKSPTPIQASFIPAALAPAEGGEPDALRSRDLCQGEKLVRQFKGCLHMGDNMGIWVIVKRPLFFRARRPRDTDPPRAGQWRSN